MGKEILTFEMKNAINTLLAACMMAIKLNHYI